MIGNLFAPAAAVPNPTDEQKQQLLQGWKGFFANPDNQAALLSFGTQMLQPLAPGQNLMGQIGQALGKAGETVSNRAEAEAEARKAADELRLRQEENQIDRERLAQDAEQFGKSLDVERYRALTAADRGTARAQLTADAVLREMSDANEKIDARIGEIRASLSFSDEEKTDLIKQIEAGRQETLRRVAESAEEAARRAWTEADSTSTREPAPWETPTTTTTTPIPEGSLVAKPVDTTDGATDSEVKRLQEEAQRKALEEQARTATEVIKPKPVSVLEEGSKPKGDPKVVEPPPVVEKRKPTFMEYYSDPKKAERIRLMGRALTDPDPAKSAAALRALRFLQSEVSDPENIMLF